MIQIAFSVEEINKLDHERYHYPNPKVQKKMEVLYLKSMGLPHNEICRLCKISNTTLATYLKQYLAGGLEGLKKQRYKGRPNELLKHQTSLEAYFKEHLPRTAVEAQAIIEERTGIRRSPTQVRAFLKRIGMKCRKVGAIPGKAADQDKQEEQEKFQVEELEPRLVEAKEGKRNMLFVDSAHFVFAAFLGLVWSFERIFIPSPSGRKRFNVLGALDAVTKKVLTVTNETYINAESVCQLLFEIAQHYGTAMPTTVVLDNARYQKCALVQNYAAELGIELLYLPSYSPQLNLIERYWRFLRKKCLYSICYANFNEFKAAIEECIALALYKHSDELESLLTWNFQSFKKVKISSV